MLSKDEALETLLFHSRQVLRRETWAKRYLVGLIVFPFLFVALIRFWVCSQPVLMGPFITFPPVVLDTAFTPPRDLDIVVAHYSEPLPELQETLSLITSLPTLKGLIQNITIYTKHPTIPLSTISTALSLSPTQIYRLPNRGREGGTYLTHLLTNYDSLATHTLFLQASVHNRAYMLQRLNDYFSPKTTGYLSLGFAGKTCELTNCVDEWGWRDRFSQLPGVFALLYGAIAPPGKLLLSYKGQFMVSARRVRGGGGRKLLEYLKQLLEGDDSPYSLNDLSKDDDDRSAPEFGYVLERAWGLVFGCADARMAASCPTLWKARGKGIGDGSCQCLDPVAVA